MSTRTEAIREDYVDRGAEYLRFLTNRALENGGAVSKKPRSHDHGGTGRYHLPVDFGGKFLAAVHSLATEVSGWR